ncbi:MAG TPA: glycosyltransferase family 39 protein, partial [Blastocatellia bacterium]|nr:glycosyltransferase family 39 protein [Blastocatellia bacterium]
MQLTAHTRQIDRSAWSEAGTVKEVALLLAVLLATAAFFGLLFDKETALSYSIGYNLYGARRILGGETPYKDFHTLYPPATVYLNAAIFRLLGISLYNALLGVFIFKVLTTAALYLGGRMIMPRAWALLVAASSLLWLRPNGPFKAVPMHYGALFLAATLLLVLSYLRDRRRATLIAAGLALGILALFKHNIGAYALAGALLVILPERGKGAFKPASIFRNYREALILAIGFIIPVLLVVILMAYRGALGPMARTLLFGPGDFLLSRLAGWPSPVGFLIFALALAGAVMLGFKWRAGAKMKGLAWLILLACCLFVILSGQGINDSLIFYAPVGVILWGLTATLAEFKRGEEDWRVSLAVLVVAASAFLEAFPRFAREQAVASMPFVTLLLLYQIRRSYRFVIRLTGADNGRDFSRMASAAAL